MEIPSLREIVSVVRNSLSGRRYWAMFSANLSAVVGGRLLALVTLPVWTHYLAPSDFGIVTSLKAYTNLLVTFTGLGMSAVILRLGVELRQTIEEVAALRSTVIVVVVGAGGFLVLYGLLFGKASWNSLTSGSIPYSPYVLSMLLLVVAVNIHDVSLGALRAEERHGQVSWLMFLRSCLEAGTGVILVLSLGFGAFGLWTGYVIAASVATAMAFRSSFAGTKLIVPTRKELSGSLRLGVPFMVQAMASMVMFASDRIMVESIRGLREAGIYGLAAGLAIALHMVFVTGSNVYSPKYYRLRENVEKNGSALEQFTDLWILLASCCVIMATILGPSIARLIVDERYHEGLVSMSTLVVAIYFVTLYQFAVRRLLFFKQSGRIAFCATLAAISNVVFNLIFIPRMGGHGAALATVASCAIMLLVSGFVSDIVVSRIILRRGAVVLCCVAFSGLGIWVESVRLLQPIQVLVTSAVVIAAFIVIAIITLPCCRDHITNWRNQA
ncbi:MAG: oligosaccharide flippase family protein [Verrucomicrobiae bacterium]|nr:oligosaccharide flippase family protein [Verrucomicrobiae bacterium]